MKGVHLNMCGIIGYTGHNKAVPYLIKGLEKLEYRGYDSSGIALSENDTTNIIKSTGKLCNLKERIKNIKSDASCGIGHTRWATHGAPDENNAHPHKSSSELFTVVHNGIIENYLPLKKELIREGFSFYSQTDTEVIANLLEKYYENDPFQALKKCIGRLEGSYALAIICRDFPGKIFATRKSSPLLAASSNKGTFVASDATAVLGFSREIYTLKEYEIAVLTKNSAEFYSPEGKKIKKEKENIVWSENQTEKDGYAHYMLKEIYEQPEALRKTLSDFVKDGEIFPEHSAFINSLSEIGKVYFIGCGSAYHAGVTGKMLTEKLSGISAAAEIASEFRYGDSPVDKSTLCVFISQSGETADTLAALMKAKDKGAAILSVVNVKGSSLARESNNVLYTNAGPEIAVATTKAYSTQLITLYLLSLAIANKKGAVKNDEYERLLKEALSLPDKIQYILGELMSKIRKASELFNCKADGYFIGRGLDYSAALEGSLKMKEISYIHTEAYPAGELKHGSISLIEKGTPVVALCCQESLFDKMQSAVGEVASRGAEVLTVTNQKLRSRLPVQENVLILPDTDELFSVPIEVCALQLLSYHTALEKGLDIDKPRNLAKSVTVE